MQGEFYLRRRLRKAIEHNSSIIILHKKSSVAEEFKISQILNFH